MKRRLVKLLGYAICILVPLAAAIDQFGYQVQTVGAAALLLPSGSVLLLMLLCFKPVFNWLTRIAKNAFKTDAAWKMWLVLAVVMFVFWKIGYPMFIVSAFGTAGNIVGGLLIRWASKEEKT